MQETIFDYNPTEEELRWFFPPSIFKKIPTKEEYIETATPIGRIADLCRLGILRKDKKFAKKYFDMIPETPKKYLFLYRDFFNSWEEAKEWDELIDYLTDGRGYLVAEAHLFHS
ncbi:MAG: hypothetical protein ACK4VK_07280 [Aquificaceae bacterium]